MLKAKSSQNDTLNEEQALLRFVQQTKEGKFTSIDVNYIVFSRSSIEDYSCIIPEQEYYYGIS
ncbi:MAG: hypothetical protein PHE50_00705 [Dehalococcoidales bacterium]|nr:hypothetical protein [Dehalococcoidales bacterium]